jgi:hypothetical protein
VTATLASRIGKVAPVLTRAARGLTSAAEVSRCLAAPSPVVVYTAPKTGSTSVEAALAAAGIHAAKAHSLHRQHHKGVARRREMGRPLERHHLVERRLMDRLPSEDGPRWRVVSLVRDPVAQRLSGSFQAPEGLGLDLADLDGVRRHVAGRVESMAARGRAFAWFEVEIGATFGVEAAADFDAEAGHGRSRGRGADVLVLKMEALDRLGPILSEFVGRELAIERRNERQATGDAARYRAARAGLRFSGETLDAIYETPEGRAFYTPDERAAFRARWLA